MSMEIEKPLYIVRKHKSTVKTTGTKELLIFDSSNLYVTTDAYEARKFAKSYFDKVLVQDARTKMRTKPEYVSCDFSITVEEWDLKTAKLHRGWGYNEDDRDFYVSNHYS